MWHATAKSTIRFRGGRTLAHVLTILSLSRCPIAGMGDSLLSPPGITPALTRTLYRSGWVNRSIAAVKRDAMAIGLVIAVPTTTNEAPSANASTT